MTALLAVQNADVLRAMAEIDAPFTVADLARSIGRDKSNLTKTIAKLREEALVDADTLALTAAGAALIPRLDVLDGRAPLPAKLVTLRHDQLAPSPLNPRKDFDSDEAQEAMDTLRISIIERGLMQNLVARAEPGANGVRWIVAGERRWRAIGLAIAEGDLPASFPIACKLEAITDAEHEADALIENLLRRDLHPLEEAVAFKRLADLRGTREVAELAGRTQRHVQERIKLLELSDENQERMRLPKDDPQHLSVTGAREAVQQPREQIDLEELLPARTGRPLTAAQASERHANAVARENERDAERDRERRDAHTARLQELTTGWSDDEAELIERARHALVNFDLGVRGGDEDGVRQSAELYDATIWKLNGETMFGCRSGQGSAGYRIEQACAAKDGEIPIWGQSGRFVIETEDFRAALAIKDGLKSYRHASVSCEFHVIDTDRPFISETGFRSHFGDYRYGHTLADAVGGWVVAARYDYQKKRPIKLVRVEPGRLSIATDWPWVAAAVALRVLTPAVTAEAPMPAPAGPTPRPAAEPPGDDAEAAVIARVDALERDWTGTPWRFPPLSPSLPKEDDFCALLAELGVQLPLLPGAGHEGHVLFGQDGTPVLTVEAGNIETTAAAIAKLVCIAVHVCSGKAQALTL